MINAFLTSLLLVPALFFYTGLSAQKVKYKTDLEPRSKVLKAGKKIEVQGIDVESISRSLITSGGYDGGSIKVSDSSGYTKLHRSVEALGRHQSEFTLYNVGSFLILSDSLGLTIQMNPVENDRYWLLVREGSTENQLPDSLFGPIELVIQAKDVNGIKADIHMDAKIRPGNLSLFCLPEGQERDVLFKARHQEDELAFFSLCTIRDQGGNTYTFGPGDYWLSSVRDWQYRP